MKPVIMRAIAIVVVCAAAAGLSVGTANARPLEEIRCTPIDRVIASAEHAFTEIFHRKDKKEEQNRCVN